MSAELTQSIVPTDLVGQTTELVHDLNEGFIAGVQEVDDSLLKVCLPLMVSRCIESVWALGLEDVDISVAVEDRTRTTRPTALPGNRVTMSAYFGEELLGDYRLMPTASSCQLVPLDMKSVPSVSLLDRMDVRNESDLGTYIISAMQRVVPFQETIRVGSGLQVPVPGVVAATFRCALMATTVHKEEEEGTSTSRKAIIVAPSLMEFIGITETAIRNDSQLTRTVLREREPVVGAPLLEAEESLQPVSAEGIKRVRGLADIALEHLAKLSQSYRTLETDDTAA